MGSKVKKGHTTHALARAVGVSHRGERSGEEQRDPVLRDFAEFCALVPNAHERAAQLNAGDELEAAGSRDERLTLLRTRRVALRQLLRSPS